MQMLILALTLAMEGQAEKPLPKPPYVIVGELTEEDRKQIESIAPDKLGKQVGEKIFEVKVTMPGMAVVSFGHVQGVRIGSLRIYHLEKRDGKWQLVRIRYVRV
jgi:hypothetical protein